MLSILLSKNAKENKESEGTWKAKLDTANKRIEEYREFINNYQAHNTLCRATADQPTKDCDCGLEEALEELGGMS